MKRCGWELTDPLMTAYHDTEWGVPVHDDRKLFEFLVLDAFQAGVSWAIVLRKRENFRRAFHGFDPGRVARYADGDVERLMADAGIIRNRLKIRAAIVNARCFLAVRKEFGTFDAYLWKFVGGRTIHHRLKTLGDMPAVSPESEALSRDLKARGFKFVGPTICYAFMQAAGLINDHTIDCFRRREIMAGRKNIACLLFRECL